MDAKENFLAIKKLLRINDDLLESFAMETDKSPQINFYKQELLEKQGILSFYKKIY